MSPILDGDRIIRTTLESLQGALGDLIDLKTFVMNAAKAYDVDGTRPINDTEAKAAILRFLNELLRGGIIGLGDNKNGGWDVGFCYLTEHGKKTAEQASRDPINQTGYLAYLEQNGPLDATTKGYVEESLATYRSCCYRATAVLIGAAVENLVLDLRDELLGRIVARGEQIPKGLDSWKVKEVVEAIAARVLPDLRSAGKSDEHVRNLKEDAESRLAPIAAEFRRLRNDAGHPAALSPVQPADAHANMLLFPSTVSLLRKIKAWVKLFYS